jgi:hypothetical protein
MLGSYGPGQASGPARTAVPALRLSAWVVVHVAPVCGNGLAQSLSKGPPGERRFGTGFDSTCTPAGEQEHCARYHHNPFAHKDHEPVGCVVAAEPLALDLHEDGDGRPRAERSTIYLIRLLGA